MPVTGNTFPADSGADAPPKLPQPGEGVVTSEGVAETGAEAASESQQSQSVAPSDERFIKLVRAADLQARNYAEQNFSRAIEQSYKSFRSEYIPGSKYKSADYRNRSQIFRPKTRIAVTKDMAGAAQTLFSTVDAVTTAPGDDSDPMQVANAELIGALINYRLDRTSGKNAIPWFMVAMGSRQDCQIAGYCVSKQCWSYQENKAGNVIKDKPEIELFSPENVRIDPAAQWIDPVNSGAYFGAAYPMHVQDVKNRMKDEKYKWRELDDADETGRAIWTGARVQEFEAANIRRAREGGTDRLDNQTSTDREFDVVWVYEWFIRFDDEDWCFWTLGRDHLLSDPKPTLEVYPWKGGERPYRIGFGNLEAHRIVPQSPVETLGPLQQEINDITNLRLDNLKQVIQPVALVKRGKKVDTEALKRRYPVLYVENPKEDVQWDRPPDSAASSFAETSRLDTDFDDLSGTFNGGSVANNRQVGETVGGMRLMSGAANAVSEFYVRIWVETWVEPVLADLAKLEAYYESDTKILALAKKRAGKKIEWGENEITDELLSQEVIVRVSAGVGSPDPMQKQAKTAQAIDLTSKMLPASRKFASGELQLNEEALINHIWGNAGVGDAFDKFFVMGQPMPQPGQEQPAPDPGMTPIEAQDKAADRQSKESIAKLNAKTKIATTLIQARADQRGQEREHAHDGKHVFINTMMDALIEQQGLRERAEDRKLAAQKPAPAAAAL